MVELPKRALPVKPGAVTRFPPPPPKRREAMMQGSLKDLHVATM